MDPGPATGGGLPAPPAFRTSHAIDIAAPPDAVWRALREIRVTDVPLLVPLMAFRAIPLVFVRSTAPIARGLTGLPLLEAMHHFGFVTLAGESGASLTLGAIGRFWHPTRGAPVLLRDAAAFHSFAEPGYARAYLELRYTPTRHGTRLTTVTSVEVPDRAAWRFFALYWTVVRPGSGLLRWSLLHAVRQRAERPL